MNVRYLFLLCAMAPSVYGMQQNGYDTCSIRQRMSQPGGMEAILKELEDDIKEDLKSLVQTAAQTKKTWIEEADFDRCLETNTALAQYYYHAENFALAKEVVRQLRIRQLDELHREAKIQSNALAEAASPLESALNELREKIRGQGSRTKEEIDRSIERLNRVLAPIEEHMHIIRSRIAAWHTAVAPLATEIHAHFIGDCPITAEKQSLPTILNYVQGCIPRSHPEGVEATLHHKQRDEERRRALENIALNPWDTSRETVGESLLALSEMYKYGIGGPACPERAAAIAALITDRCYKKTPIMTALDYQNSGDHQKALRMIEIAEMDGLSESEKIIADFIRGRYHYEKWIHGPILAMPYHFIKMSKALDRVAAKPELGCVELAHTFAMRGTACFRQVCFSKSCFEHALDLLGPERQNTVLAYEIKSNLGELLADGSPEDRIRARNLLIESKSYWERLSDYYFGSPCWALLQLCYTSNAPEHYALMRPLIDLYIKKRLQTCSQSFRKSKIDIYLWRIKDSLGTGKRGSCTKNYALARTDLEECLPLAKSMAKKQPELYKKILLDLARLYCEELGGPVELEKARPLLEQALTGDLATHNFPCTHYKDDLYPHYWSNAHYYLAYVWYHGIAGKQKIASAESLLESIYTSKNVQKILKKWQAQQPHR